MAVYVLRRIIATTEAGYQLSEQESEDLLKRRGEALKAAGGKIVGQYRSYAGRGTVYIISYPSLEAAEKDRVAVWNRDGLNLSRYYTAETDLLYELPVKS